jgi:hypothetical protein
MRRRPIEFWWIAVFSLFQGFLAYFQADSLASSFDRNVLSTFHGGFIAASILLICFTTAGRIASSIFMGLFACYEAMVLAQGMSLPLQSLGANAIYLGFCLWMFFYLHSDSTKRMCSRSPVGAAARASLYDVTGLDVLELALGAGAAYLASLAGAGIYQAGAVGVICYVSYGVALEEWVRRRWITIFARCEEGFPLGDVPAWRAACRALTRKDFAGARLRINDASLEARNHSASKLFLAVLEWQELLAQPPADGRQGLRRAAYDYDWTIGSRVRLSATRSPITSIAPTPTCTEILPTNAPSSSMRWSRPA